MATATERVEIHRWTRRDYHRMAETGLLRPDERTELVDGVIYTMSPQGTRHATVVHLVADALRSVLPGAYLRLQVPLALGNYSEPEPDVAVVTGSPRDYLDDHPTAALLVVEVADSSLRHDRMRKLPLYARSGLPEVWIVDLAQRTLEVYREPGPEAYRSQTVLRSGDRVSPLSRPDAVFTVADLLP